MAKIELALDINFELKQTAIDSAQNKKNIIPITENCVINNANFSVIDMHTSVDNYKLHAA